MIETTGKVAEKVVNGLSGSPGMLLVVVLNIIMIGTCGYALVKIAEMSSLGRTQIMSVLEACIAGGSHNAGQ
jgi:hypothetical protein